MNSNWETVSLELLFEFKSGLSKPRSEFGFGQGFLSFKDVFYNYFVPDNLSQLVNSNGKEQISCSVKAGDVFLTRTSETMDELGMSCVALKDYENATFNGFTKRLRAKEGVRLVPEYMGYYFRSPQFRRNVTAMSTLSTRASLNNEMLARLSIVVPPMKVQVAIGSVLKSLDDKIELNRRMNETLESIARAIFKSWFVDFDPVRAKLVGNTHEQQSRASAYLMPAEVYDLFPSAFQDSELGKIPEGWEALSFSDNVQILSGGTPKTKIEEYWNGEIPWYTVKDAPKSSDIWCIDTERAISQAGLDNSAAELFDIGISIISARGTVGKVALVGKPMAMNQSCYGIKGCNGFGDFFTYFNLLNAIGALQQRSHGSVFDTITRDTFNSLTTVYPTPEVAQEFNDLVAPLLEMILGNASESETLAQLRDTLLPKLLSGELTVPDALLQAEEVL